MKMNPEHTYIPPQAAKAARPFIAYSTAGDFLFNPRAFCCSHSLKQERAVCGVNAHVYTVRSRVLAGQAGHTTLHRQGPSAAIMYANQTRVTQRSDVAAKCAHSGSAEPRIGAKRLSRTI